MAKPISKEFKQQWKDKIYGQRSSNLSIAAWCRQNGVAVHVFYVCVSLQSFPLRSFEMESQILQRAIVRYLDQTHVVLNACRKFVF